MKRESWRKIKKNRNNLKILFEMYRNGDNETKRRINFYLRKSEMFNTLKKNN